MPDAVDKLWLGIYKNLDLTDAEIDEMEGRPSAAPMTTERRVEILKGMGDTDEEIQAKINRLPPPPPTAKLARGGQAGNTNALKHGFYASLFNSADQRRLEKFDQREIDEDITLLRVLIKRAAAFVLKPPKDHPLTFGEYLTAVRVITYACARLEKLQRTKLLLRGSGEDRIQKAIFRALDELNQEGFIPGVKL